MAGSRPAATRRRIYFIDKKFQRNFILKFCGLVAAGGMATMALLYVCTTQSSTVSLVNSRAVVRTTANFLLPLFVQTVIIVTILISLGTIVMTLLVSHKIAGPLYRLKRIVEALGEGEVAGEFRLRRRDQLQELAHSLNDTMSKIKARVAQLKDGIGRLNGALLRLSEQDIAAEKRSDLKELKKTAAELEKTIQYFRI